MKKLLALLLAAVLSIGSYKAHYRLKSFEPEARSASGAIFMNKDGQRRFYCSGTEIGKTKDGGGIFLTARHCVANTETNKIYENLTVSFSANQSGPFYDATPIALSLTDDLALLYLNDGADIPSVAVKDERRLSSGAPLFNVSFPLGSGKAVFHGEYMGSFFPSLPLEIMVKYTQWIYAMPMNLTIAHGSSGSGVFSQSQHGLVGVAVGTFEEGSYNIAIPGDRVLDFLNDLKDNTVEKFKYAYPEQEESLLDILFGSHNGSR
jgi:S1-C subfamily serine protease